MSKNATNALTAAPIAATVATSAAALREMRVLPSVIATVAASGSRRVIQAQAVII